MIPVKPGVRVKTNRRDAVNLAKLLRAGDLTAVWVPDDRHEAMRDLARAREAAQKDYKAKRQQVSSFLLRLDRPYPGKTTWGKEVALEPRAGICFAFLGRPASVTFEGIITHLRVCGYRSTRSIWI